jgi:hypothetical protein
MSRFVTERLMTLEEALQLSRTDNDPHREFEPHSHWSWQSVARAMAQEVSDQQIEAMARVRSNSKRNAR